MSDEQPYQVMPDLDAEKYERLKQDIANNGIEYPIILDGDGEIIDGHHRYEAWIDLDRDPDDLPTRVVDDTSSDNYHRAYRANLLRRDLSDGTKRDVVKQYLLEHPDRVAEDTQEEIAEDLGVSTGLVNNAKTELEKNGKSFTDESFTTDEKREQVREYAEDNPDASNREVAREVDCDVTHVTVGNWRDEWEIQEPSTGLDTYTNTKSEADDALDVVDTATDETADEEVRKTAQENADRLSDGDTTPSTASKNVGIAEANQQVKEDRQTTAEHEYTPHITNADARQWLENDAPKADVVVTDPPYTTDVDDVQAFAKSWVPKVLNTVKRDGYAYIFVGSYTDELVAYLQELQKTDFYVQPLVWNYRNTLGRSPSDRYKRDWQAILYCRAPEAGDLNAPKTSELRTVQEVNAPGMVGDDSERHHKWQKPRKLVEQYIGHGSEKGDVVVDPFAGSGEILLAAADIGRDAYGCDIDEEAISTATSRGCEKQ